MFEQLAVREESNPLAQLAAIAEANKRVWDAYTASTVSSPGGSWLGALPEGASVETLPTVRGKVTYPTIEQAGIGGLYQWLLNQKDLEIVFANDLACEIHGIDAVARRRDDGRFLICEAKGTTQRIQGATSYLKPTKARGRQLSWDWCWSSVIDMAEHPPAAATFLALHGPMILDKVERLLAVSRVTRSKGGFIVAETRCWCEAELRRWPWLSEPRNWTKQRRWLEAMGRVPGPASDQS